MASDTPVLNSLQSATVSAARKDQLFCTRFYDK